MFVVCVHVQVKPECIEDFIAASRENASSPPVSRRSANRRFPPN